MDGQLGVLIEQLLLFFTFIACGYIFNRLKLFTEDLVFALSRTVVKVLLPLMVLTALPSGGSRDQVLGMIPFLGGIVIMYLILFGMGFLSAKVLRLKQPTYNLHAALMGFTNSGFMGLPLLMAVYPEKAVLCFVPYAFMECILLYGKMGYLMRPVGQAKEKFSFKQLITPMNVCMVVGVLLLLLNIKPQNPIWEGMHALGGTCKYMALLYIGGVIGVKGFGTLLKRWQTFIMVPLKLIIAPILVFLIVRAIGFLDETSLMILTTYAMLPCMVMVSILADANGCDGEYGMSAVLVTTICSLVTIPAVTWFITTVL